ncbi:SDR family oxidoreductase [Sporichthya brevicatena]|uniref:SDR family oxidoreductase n=1 Tax=Sporichthya brevicatena TaxID=171442 RepID=A0ABN1GUI6_9ACTN
MTAAGALDGQVALITAAAGAGIGRATARTLALAGADVVITDLDAGRTAKVADALAEETGRKIVGRPLDVRDEAAITALVDEVLADRGRIDLLVNNAGTSEPAPLWETSTESWHRVLDVCLTGHFLLMRAVLPHMIERGSGCIVNIASIEAWTDVIPDNVVYQTAKSGVVGLTRATAAQVGRFGVRVNGVAPGLVPNPFLSRMIPADDLRRLHERAPLQHTITPEDIANAVLFLAGDSGRSITGETINVSSGAYMRA